MTSDSLQSLEQVRREILARLQPLGAESVPVARAGGRTLACTIHAAEALPPFDNTAMDGFAVRAVDIATADATCPVALRVVGTVAAGASDLPHVGPGTAARIYTGATVPPGADAIVPVEDSRPGPSQDHVLLLASARPGAHVRRRGEDLAPGDEVLAAGTRLGPAAIGLLAMLGQTSVDVRRRPRVAVHSSGNELVPIESTPGPGKIRNSNLYALCARLSAWGAEPLPRPVLRDDPEAVRRGLEETLALAPDAILTTGGISAGDLDHVRDVARALGETGDVRVRKVDMKPGKPLVDGLIRGVPFFGLPGNPAACLVSFEIFVRPALALLEGRADGMAPRRRARLFEPLHIPRAGRRQFLRGIAQVSMDSDGELVVRNAGMQGSHMLSSFARANCLIDVSADCTGLPAGGSVDILLLDTWA